MDPVDTKITLNTLGGSFWYRGISESARALPRAISHSVAQESLLWQGQEAADKSLGYGYVDRQEIAVRFSAEDIFYFGVKASLQKRAVGGPSQEALTRMYELSLGPGFLGMTDTLQIGSDYYMPVQFPDKTASGTLPPDYRLMFGLKVPDDYLIRTIRLPDGTLLLQGVDFQSYFGFLVFLKNPGPLFSGMKLVASRVTVRSKNILCYSLGIDPVYGDVDRVLHYYRDNQSVPAFYLAAAQAAGMPVTNTTVTVLSSSPLQEGYIYYTTGGTLTASYAHERIPAGTNLPEGYVVGNELFSVYPASSVDTIPLRERMNLSLDNLLPVRGLSAPWGAVMTTLARSGIEYIIPVANEYNLDSYTRWLPDPESGIAASASWLFGDKSLPELDILSGLLLTREKYTQEECYLTRADYASANNIGAVQNCRFVGKWSQGCLWDISYIGVTEFRLFSFEVSRLATGLVQGTSPLISLGGDLVINTVVAGSVVKLSGMGLESTLTAGSSTKVHILVTIVAESTITVKLTLGASTKTVVVPFPEKNDFTLSPSAGIILAAATIFSADMSLVSENVLSFYMSNWTGSCLTACSISPNNAWNAAERLLKTTLAYSGIVVRMDRQKLSQTMQNRLDTFLEREKPAGSVLLYDKNASIIRV